MEQAILFHPQQQRVLLVLLENKPMNYTQLAKKMETNCGNVLKPIKLINKYKLIDTKKIGRVVNLTLTERGLFIAQRLSEIYKQIKEVR